MKLEWRQYLIPYRSYLISLPDWMCAEIEAEIWRAEPGMHIWEEFPGAYKQLYKIYKLWHEDYHRNPLFTRQKESMEKKKNSRTKKNDDILDNVSAEVF